METNRYYVKFENMYVHFNWKEQIYFISDKLVGACVFYEQPGKEFIEQHLNDNWKLCLIENAKIIKI